MTTKLFYLTLLCALSFFSCIKDEPLGREADIDAISIPEEILVRANISFDEIEITLKNGADVSDLAPVLQLSEGATVVPASGEVLDFSDNMVYTVTSEDGQYKKEYKVKINFPPIELKYDFEDWGIGGGLWKFPQLSDLMWDSANLGVSWAFLGKVEEYPTKSTTDAHSGEYAAILKTIKGGTFKSVGYVPIFSGSLYTGNFKLKISNPLESTLFGQIHPQESGKPRFFNGYYKYKPGETFTDKEGVVVPDRVDEYSIYAVIFKVTKGTEGLTEYLNGENILTSDKIVATAIWDDTSEKSEYTRFSVPFVYTKELDYDQNAYKMALVFASSKDGDRYAGAIGSTLIVDEVEVICEEIRN